MSWKSSASIFEGIPGDVSRESGVPKQEEINAAAKKGAEESKAEEKKEKREEEKREEESSEFTD